MSAIQAATRRAQADEPFVEHARPDADPVGRGLEQPRHRRRGHFARRGRAVATTARPDDGVLVSLDIDLEQRGAALAVGGVELATTRTDARILRWFARFLLLPEAGALGAAVRHRAAGRACARCPFPLGVRPPSSPKPPRWREFRFVLNQVRRTIEPDMREVLTDWPDISRGLSEPSRRRRPQIERYFPDTVSGKKIKTS